jgi:hypothetical protein
MLQGTTNLKYSGLNLSTSSEIIQNTHIVLPAKM